MDNGILLSPTSTSIQGQSWTSWVASSASSCRLLWDLNHLEAAGWQHHADMVNFRSLCSAVCVCCHQIFCNKVTILTPWKLFSPHHFIILKDSDSNILPLWCDSSQIECCSYGRHFPFCVIWSLCLASLSNIYCFICGFSFTHTLVWQCRTFPAVGKHSPTLFTRSKYRTTNLHQFLLPALSPAFLYFCSSFIGFPFLPLHHKSLFHPPSLVRCLFRTHLKETVQQVHTEG